MMFRTSLTAVAVLAIAAPASAATVSYGLDLSPLNDSGVSGSGSFVVDTEANTISTEISASGLESGMPHAQHIHGALDGDGNRINSVSPTPAVDDPANGGDGDGFIDLVEGRNTYGPVLIPLTNEDGSFPTAPDGTVDYQRTFDLTDSGIFNNDFDARDVISALDDPALDLREVVLHGMTVPAGVGGIGDGSSQVLEEGGYSGFLPVASGEITEANTPTPSPIPLPAAGWAMAAGLGGLGALRARRKAAKS